MKHSLSECLYFHCSNSPSQNRRYGTFARIEHTGYLPGYLQHLSGQIIQDICWDRTDMMSATSARTKDSPGQNIQDLGQDRRHETSARKKTKDTGHLPRHIYQGRTCRAPLRVKHDTC